MSASTRLLALNAARDLVDVRPVGAFADQQALGLDAEHDRDGHEQHADRDGADAVPHGVAGEDGQADAGEGEDQAEQRGDVFEQDHRQLGLLGVPDERRSSSPCRARGSTRSTAVRSEKLSSPIATSEHHDRQPRHLERVRVGQLLDALVQREDPADREQDDRDDEREDIALAAVAERVLRVGGPARPAAAEQQQELVARVGDRVHGLGEHGARAGEHERDELGDRDTGVREEGGDDRLRAAGCTHESQTTLAT